MKLPTREQLEKRRTTTLADMQSKMDAEDFHGVQDCGSDLREIDAMLNMIEARTRNCEKGTHLIQKDERYFVCDGCGAMFRQE